MGTSIFGQPNLRFKHLSSQHGLVNNVVNCMVQDAEGFVWIGTDEGLNRYDGIQFRPFPLVNERLNKIGRNVQQIFIDLNGRMWVCTPDAGLFLYDRDRLVFESYQLDGATDHIELHAITQTSDSVFFVGFNRLPMRQFRFGEEPQEAVGDPRVFRHNADFRFFRLRDGSTYAAPLGGSLCRYENEKWMNTLNALDTTINLPTINALAEASEEVFFGGWSNELFSHSKAKNTLQRRHVITAGDEINSLLAIDNILWIGTRKNGLQLLNIETGDLTDLGSALNEPNALLSNEIKCFLHDSEGRVWIGTTNGISIFDPTLFQFQVDYLPTEAGVDPINCIFEEPERLFIGSQSGLFVLQDQTIQRIPLSQPNLAVHSIQRDLNNQLWLGTNQTLYRINEYNGELNYINSSYYNQPRDSFPILHLHSSRVNVLATVDLDYASWLIGSAYGYYLFALDDKVTRGYTFKTFVHDTRDTLVVYLINKLHVDQNKRLWVLDHTHGAMVIDQLPFSKNSDLTKALGYQQVSYSKNDTFVEVDLSKHPVQDLPKPCKAQDLIEYAPNRFYLTTYGSGLFDIQLRNGRWTATLVPSPHKSLEGIAIDAEGNIWIIANGGFDCYRPQLDLWQRFDYRDGFPKQGVRGRIYPLENGRFVAGGYGYLVSFDPLAIRPNPSAPKTTITSFAVFSEPHDTLLGQAHVRLNSTQNVVSFSFSALNFTNPEMSQFRYQLLGADPIVIDAGTRNFASYANLQPGEYAFKVWSSNNHGIWNDEPAVFAFTIVPPLWQRPIFIYICLIALVVVVLVLYQLRIRQIHRRQQLKLAVALEAQENERARLATDLHDDLGTKMSTVKLFLNSLEPYLEAEKAIHINSHAQNMLDQSISGLRNVLADLSPRLLQKAGLIAAISEIASQVNQGDKMKVHFIAPEKEHRFVSGIEVALFRVVQELIHNAIKHSKCTIVTIELSYKPYAVELVFTDNGIGFTSEQQARGYGIRNIKQRLELIGGEALWHPAEGGTKVQIIVPYKPALHDAPPTDSPAAGR